ncbi:MAG: GntR family transcriptional regulator [Bacillota bacterium]
MPDDNILSPVHIEPLSQVRDKVYEKLREAILMGHLKPGARLVERKIAEQLNVSRTPVREAIRVLELEGLVSHLPRVGVVVAEIEEKEVIETYRIRAVLEGLAARLAAERRDRAIIDRLGSCLLTMEHCAQQGSIDRLEKAHREFNDLIYRAADSPRLYSMLTSLTESVYRYVRIGYSLPGRIEEAAGEHRRLFEALRAGNAHLSEQIAREHIENSSEAFFKEISKSDGVKGF